MTINLHNQFKRDFKALAKKYPSLEGDIDELVISLLENPTQGVSLGNNRFKIRLKITSKRQGKSGGGRVITYVKTADDTLWLLTMYDKSDMENVSDGFLDDLVKLL